MIEWMRCASLNIDCPEEEIKTLMEKGIEGMLAISPKSKLEARLGYLKTTILGLTLLNKLFIFVTF